MVLCQKPSAWLALLSLAALSLLQSARGDVGSAPYPPPGGPGGFPPPGNSYLPPGSPGSNVATGNGGGVGVGVGGGGGGVGGGVGGIGPLADEPSYPPTPYNFKYDVQDAPSGNDFGHEETGDGAGTADGKYYVLLPDGRKQIVTYHADANGYVATVQYEGEAQFPPPPPPPTGNGNGYDNGNAGGNGFNNGNVGGNGNGFNNGNVGGNGNGYPSGNGNGNIGGNGNGYGNGRPAKPFADQPSNGVPTGPANEYLPPRYRK